MFLRMKSEEGEDDYDDEDYSPVSFEIHKLFEMKNRRKTHNDVAGKIENIFLESYLAITVL